MGAQKTTVITRIVRTLVGAIGVFSLSAYAADEDPASLSCAAADDASRIAIAGGSITEILYDVGEQGRIVAVDRTSNYPQAATELPSVGYVRNLSAEGILSLSPTLILGEDDMGPVEVVTQLHATGIDVRRLNEVHTAEGIVAKLDCVASIIGMDAAKQAQERQKLMAVLAQLEDVNREKAPRIALLLSLSDGVPTAGGADTSATGVIEMAGGSNVFSEFEGWKPVSLEALAQAAPDFIVMPVRGVAAAGGLEAVQAHPAIRLTPAGAAGHIIAVDGMTLLGFGPRTLGAALELARTFGTLQAPSTPTM
ncbi:MAG: ABC transporter substrate-binding protein [Pseudomonadota bacterium]